jgi:hypothetical protein
MDADGGFGKVYEPYYESATRFTRARGEHGLKLVGTLQALSLGGIYQRPKKGVSVDNNGRQWQTNEVEMEVELEKDAEGNVIPLLREDGSPVRDPQTGMRSFNYASIPKQANHFCDP